MKDDHNSTIKESPTVRRTSHKPNNGTPSDDLSIYDLSTKDVARQFGVIPKSVLRWLSLPDTDPEHLRGLKMNGRRWVCCQRDVDARKRRLLKTT